MSIFLNIIGAGHVGKTLAHLLSRNHLVKIQSICNTSIESSREAQKFIGEGDVCRNIEELPQADITMLTPPDHQILNVSQALSENNHLKAGSIVFHCSGTLSSEVLFSLKNKGCFTASIHPLHSFADPKISIEKYSGTYCTVEGDEQALNILCPLFENIGALVHHILPHKKALYHIGSIFASNYLVTLAEQASACFQEAGIEESLALEMILELMKNTLRNLENSKSFQNTLSGPIKRGDASLIQTHMNTLPVGLRKKLYGLLGTLTLPLALLSPSREKNLKHILEND